jgi:hypothetical protein
MRTDIFALPRVPLAYKGLLPSLAAVYFLTDETKVIYVGRTVDLFNRWRNHTAHLSLRRPNNPVYFIRYLVVPKGIASGELELAFQIRLWPVGGMPRSFGAVCQSWLPFLQSVRGYKLNSFSQHCPTCGQLLYSHNKSRKEKK